jgi:hypothetical protein
MRHLRRVVLIFFTLLLLSNFGKGQSVSLSLKGGLFVPTTSEFTGPLVDAFNLKLKNKVDLFEQVGFLSVESQEMADIGNYRTVGAELELKVHEKISVAVGLEFGKRSTSAFFEARSIGSDSYMYSRDYKLEISLLPVYATVRYYFFRQDFNLYTGAGMGFCMETIRGSSQFEEITESGEDLYWKAEGSAFIPHLNVGVVYKFTRWLSLALDLRYAYGKISEFEVKESENRELIGQPLLLPIGESASEKFEQSFRGFNALAMLRLSF